MLSGRVRCLFVHALAVELTGVQQRRWNTERLIVFQTVTLQRARYVTKSCKIRKRIYQRLDAWEAVDHTVMVKYTARTYEQYLYTSLGEDSPDHRDNIYHILMIQENCGRWFVGSRRRRREGCSSQRTDDPIQASLS